MHRFRCDELAGLPIGSSVRLEKGESAHLFKTLRAAEGERCILMDGRGCIGEAEVAPERSLILRSRYTVTRPDGISIHLYLAPPRRQKMDQILRQCAELGVQRIIPMVCARSVSLPGEDTVTGRWTELMFEGCKQSGNVFVPETGASLRFDDALKDASQRCEQSFFGSVSDCGSETFPSACTSAAWFVGPEGGFTEEEEARMRCAGFHAFHFGNWTLRVETAAVCGIAVLMDRFTRKSAGESLSPE